MEPNLDPTLFAAVFIAMIAAGCVKGVLGLGLPLTSIAILGTVMDLRQAIPIIVVPVLVTNAFQAMQGGMLAAQFRRFWSLNLALCAGTWGGTVLLFIIDPAALVITLGAVVVGLMGLQEGLPVGMVAVELHLLAQRLGESARLAAGLGVQPLEALA